METDDYHAGSSLFRQGTFETDERFARSKSGSVRKGNLSLPVIGPRHLIKHHSADRRQTKEKERRNSAEGTIVKKSKRAFSPDIGLRTKVQNEKTYTKGLLKDVHRQEALNEKITSKSKGKRSDDSSNKTHKVNEVKSDTKRKIDSTSADSADSLKENKQFIGAKETPSKAKIKSKDTNNSRKTIPSKDKISVSEPENQPNDTFVKNTPSHNIKRKENKQDISQTKHILSQKNETPQLQSINVDNSAKNKLLETNARRRETLRDKLTSTPISDYTSNKQTKPTIPSQSLVLVKDIKKEPAGKKVKEVQRETDGKKENVRFSSNKTTATSNVQRPENQKQKDLEKSKIYDRKKDDAKNVNPNRDSVSKATQNVKKEKSVKIQNNVSVNKRKQSIESLESGFASYRRGKEVDDVISVLSLTETEVGKPPDNTFLNSPRTDNNKISLDPNRLLIQKVGDTSREIPLFQPSSHGVIRPERKTDERRYMEPVFQRKPGSERMTETYESIYEERRTLLEAEATYKKRIKQLEDELNQFLKTIEDLRSENRALRTRIDSLENSGNSGNDNEKDQLKQSIRALEKKNHLLEEKHSKTENDLEKLKSERERLNAENKDLTTKLSDVQTEFDKSNEEMVALTRDQGNDTAKLEKDINQFRVDLRTEQTERKKLDDENTILKTDKDVLKDEVIALRSINKNLEAMNEELKNDNPTELPSSEKMELKSQIIKLQTENQVLNEENIKLKAENLKQVKTIHDLEKTNKTFASSVTAVESSKLTEIQDLKNENAKLKSEMKDLKATYSDVDSKIKTLETDNKTLDETLSQKKSELSELLTAMKGDDQFDNELKTLKAENIRLQSDIEDKEKKAEESTKRLEEIEVEKGNFESEKNELTKKINEMLEINQEQRKQMTDAQTSLESAKEEIASNKEKLKHIEKYESEISELKSNIHKTEEERDRLMKQKQEEIEELKLKIDRNAANHKEQIDAMKMEYEKEIDELKKQVEFLHKEIDELKQLKAVESELLETKDELLKVKEKYSQMVTEIDEKSDIEQKNFQLNVRMTQMNNTIKQLERDQKGWLIKKQQFDEIEASNKRLQDENISLKQPGGAQKVKKQIDKQLEVLARKQIDAETRVKQLEGWVGDLYDDETQNRATYVGSLHTKKATPPRKKAFTKAPKLPQTTVRMDHDIPRSLNDVVVKEKEVSEKSEKFDKFSHSSTPSLPAIERDARLTFGLGYSQIHRGRIKAAQKYKK